MTEPYRCGKCGGTSFGVNTCDENYWVRVWCRGQLLRDKRVSIPCDRFVTEASLTAAFIKISEKPDAKDPAPPQDA